MKTLFPTRSGSLLASLAFLFALSICSSPWWPLDALPNRQSNVEYPVNVHANARELSAGATSYESRPLTNSYGEITIDHHSYNASTFRSLPMLAPEKLDRTGERFIILDEFREELLYSAHYDDRLQAIQIVGFKHRFSQLPYPQAFCRFRDRDVGSFISPMTVYFNVSTFFPKPGLLYNTFIWICYPKTGRIPLFVEILRPPGNVLATLPVEYAPPGRRQLEFGVCVKPMVNYGNINQFIEFVEVHKLFGVDKFIVYDYSHDSSLDEVLDYYIANGVLTIHRWPLPVELDAVHDYGQKSMNHHCLLTYMNTFKYIAFIDLDEILVPRDGARSWRDVIAKAKAWAGRDTDGSYVFQSSLFPRDVFNYSEFSEDSSARRCSVATLLNTKRSAFYPIGSWSKPLVEARKTDIVDIHVVRRMMHNHTSLEVSPDIVFLHHYRKVEWNSGWMQDNGTLPFALEISKAVGKTCALFNRPG